MKIVYVVDREDSALGISAKSRAAVTQFAEVSVVEALAFCSPIKLLKHVHFLEPDYVIFSWRFIITEFFSGKLSLRWLSRLSSSSHIGALVPDYLGLAKDHCQDERQVLDFVDFFMVTNWELSEHYSKLDFRAQFLGILHDLPNVHEIRKLRNEKQNNSLNSKRIIWVGNSRWGSRQGFVDHKGLQEVFLPSMEILRHNLPSLKVCVVDSSQKRIDNHLALRLIQKSDILVQTSKSEGTGMQVLEAIGLGVIPVTTRVGIANEILNDTLPSLIVERNPTSIARSCARLLTGDGVDRKFLIEIFETTIDKWANELQSNLGKFQGNTIRPICPKPGLGPSLIRFKWLFRCIRRRYLQN